LQVIVEQLEVCVQIRPQQVKLCIEARFGGIGLEDCLDKTHIQIVQLKVNHIIVGLFGVVLSCDAKFATQIPNDSVALLSDILALHLKGILSLPT